MFTRGVATCALALGVSVMVNPDTTRADTIQQYQDNALLGYSAYRVNRSWDGIGAESGLLTRARIVTKHVHASPDFVIEGMPYTRTPSYYPAGVDSPNRYGVAGDQVVRIYVRTGGVAVAVDPFQTVRERDSIRIRRAQRRFLRDNGYTDRARLIRRQEVGLDGGDMYSKNEKVNHGLPQPRATIEIHPGLKEQRKDDLPLEAMMRTDETGRVVIGNVSEGHAEMRTAALVNGTVSVSIRTALIVD